MIKYRKFYDEPIEQFSDAGNKTERVIKMSDPNGSIYEIKESDEIIDIQAHINSFRDSCDINLLVARFKGGDISAININKSLSGGDISNIPQNVHELNDRIRSGNEIFESMPDDIKTKFNNASDFYNAIGSEQFIKALQNYETITHNNEQIATETQPSNTENSN